MSLGGNSQNMSDRYQPFSSWSRMRRCAEGELSARGNPQNTTPDELPNLILKNAANEISPFLKIIFDQSLQTGKLPDDWVEANVVPVFKKGDQHSPANYRPISLTCAKLLEHIIRKPNYVPFFEKQNFNTCTTWLSLKTLMRKPAFDYN